MSFTYPLAANGAMYDPAQVETYFNTLFRHVDWNPGELISLLGIGEKGTPKDGSDGTPPFRERKIVPPSFIGSAHTHLKRWAEHHVAGFCVPAVLFKTAGEKGDVTLDKVAALTAIILDLDSGDTEAKLAYVSEALGVPTMLVRSGGQTDEGKPKLHAYWLLNEASEEIARVAELRKELAAKVGGDQSFGRATQVIRIAGTVHAKQGKPSVCTIIDVNDRDYDLDDLADAIDGLQQMPGIEPPKPPMSQLPMLSNGMMDFTPREDTAIAALHRDIEANGEDLTRWSEFNKVAGFHIAEVRAGRMAPDAAYTATQGWMLTHMIPPWPEARFQTEFTALVNVDVQRHGPFPLTPLAAAVQQPAAAPAGIVPTPASFPAPGEIPPRPWVFGRWAMAGIVTAVISPGGIGKSSLMTGVALSCASGKEFLGKTIYGGPLVAWYWNLEDGGDNLARQRVAASMLHGVSPGDCAGRLYVDSGPEGAELCTAVEDKHGFTVIEPVFENITAAIRATGCKLLIIDPFVSSHRVNENDNNKIDAVAKRWARVAHATGCAIILVHHTTKLNGDAVTAEKARGAGALNNAARMTLVLNRMTEEQAETWGIDATARLRYFNVADDKHNLTAPDKADWFELKSVELNNGNDIYEGDSIGVVCPWAPPKALDGVDLDHLFQIQRALAAGDYWRDPQTKENWAGDVVANVLQLDACEAKSKKRIVSLLDHWIGNGTLKIETRKDEKKRKQRAAVTVGRWVADPNGASASIHDTMKGHPNG